MCGRRSLLKSVACAAFSIIASQSLVNDVAEAARPTSIVPGRLQSFRTVNRTIKSMPITERPNRAGHFYGNTVRRVYVLTNGQLNIEATRPKILINEL